MNRRRYGRCFFDHADIAVECVTGFICLPLRRQCRVSSCFPQVLQADVRVISRITRARHPFTISPSQEWVPHPLSDAVCFDYCQVHQILFGFYSGVIADEQRGSLLAGIACSNSAGGIDVCLLWFVADRGLCDGPITGSGESCQVCVIVWSHASVTLMERGWTKK